MSWIASTRTLTWENETLNMRFTTDTTQDPYSADILAMRVDVARALEVIFLNLEEENDPFCERDDCTLEEGTGASLPQSEPAASSPKPSQENLDPPSAGNSKRTTVISQEDLTVALPSSVGSNVASNRSAVPRSQESKESPTQDEKVVDGSVSVLQELWNTALAKLEASEEKQEIVEIINTFANKASGKIKDSDSEPSDAKDLAVAIKDEMEQEINSRRHDSSVTRFMGNVVSSLNKFVSFGDIAVSFDPVHAALPWAAVRTVLVMITAGSDLKTRLLEGISRVTSLFLNCNLYLRLYLDPDLKSAEVPSLGVLENLKSAIVEIYSCSVEFLGYSVRQQKQTHRRLTAPFQLDTIADYVVKLEKLAQQLLQAGDLCEKSCSFKDRAATRELLSAAKDLKQTLLNTSGMTSYMYQEDLLSKLPTVGAAFDHVDNQADVTCHPETRVELLEHIHDWILEPQGRRTFWLQGLAGTGKSTISRTIAQRLDGGVLGASFFFKRGNSDRDTGRYFFTTIAYQLARRLPSLHEHICEAIKYDPKTIDSLLEVQFRSLVSDPLKKLEADGFSGTLVIIVDALDECEDASHTKAIISLLTKSSLKCLKVFLTSRPEYDIRKLFSFAEGRYKDLTLHRIDRDVIEHDIRVVLDSRICEFRREYNILHADEDCELSDNWPGEQKLSLIVKMCAPLFISVATFFRLLQLHNWPETPDGKVDFILQKSTTSEYGSLYYPVLCRMMIGVPRGAQITAKDGFKHIVGSIVNLANPLSTKSLARLLSVNKSTVDSQLDPLHSVLDVPKDNAPVRLFHLSFRDFLTHEDAQDFQINESQAHDKLSTRCLELLSNCLKTDICGVESPGKPRDEFSEDLIAKSLPDETKYASLYWVHHVKASQCKIKDGSTVHIFLLKYFLNWLEALSLLGGIHKGIRFLEDLETSADTSSGVEVSKFLYDAKRFTMSFGPIIDEVPLQAYNAALVFAPMKSIVRHAFQSEFPKWLDKNHLPVVESEWSPLLQTLEGHIGEVQYLVFSPRGWLASASSDRIVKIWDAASGACIHTLTSQSGSATNLTVSRHGNLLAWIHDSGVDIWDADIEVFLKPVCIRDADYITSITFADDASQLFLVGNNCSLYVYGIQTGETSRIFTESKSDGKFTFAAVSGDAKWFASGSGDDNIINLASLPMDSKATSLQLVSRQKKPRANVAFSSDGKFLISLPSTNDHAIGDIEVWDTASGQFLYGLELPISAFWKFEMGSQSHRDQISMTDMNLDRFVLDLERRVFSRQTGIFDGYHSHLLALSTDGTLLAACTKHSKSIQIWDHSSTLNSDKIVDSSHVDSVDFASDSSLILSFYGNKFTVWDGSTDNPKQTTLVSESFHIKAASRKAQALALGFHGKVEIWNIALGLRMQTLVTRYVSISALSFSDDGKVLVCSSAPTEYGPGSAIEVWDTENGIHVGSPYEYDVSIPDAVISPDGKQVVVSKNVDNYRAQEIFNIVTGVQYGKVEPLQRFAFTPDGRNIVGLGPLDRSTCYLWDALTGQCMLKWKPKAGIDNLSITPKLLDLVNVVGSQINDFGDDAFQGPFRGYERGYRINDGKWIMKDGQRILWMPDGYRARYDCAAKSGNTLAIGSMNGRVMIYRFQ
ncbi:hypothetical protein NW762_010091 [Fusarium torreyae]|uniref:NACHT domain-containing protein n=1 Tax=Fusarium torreyae TaxID=1237075 RepID=A0A9W8VB99_9HYPO|nr:hypothetical protein NW762_010091 [Fusarium torreyae]